MNTATKILIGIVVVFVLLGVSIVGSYNGLVTKAEVVETNLSQIDTQLQRRNDLIPNLVETVKRFAQQEEDIFTDVADARARLAGAGTVEEQADADAALGGALSRLLAISENYPDLKSNQNFIQLQDELAGTENRIATARRDYNESARAYNTTIRRFPTVLYAGILGFEKVDYFEASEEAREVPNVGGQFGN
ncbi:LemA family protein [Alkaliphilus hydrothermalis]|uniref:LemA protein n=1 Tax=Alkaliphilus hydrothermalis TaxID=1482730 RepID=A0ABS2NRN8_9FIRM|nr:LemA family protein [Alkaliphilus hydrothermalis]MBM7615630.1 LemA protein [Alkaliphilus hydrothermalis]